MKWRFLKLDWKYAIGELFIVTAGVLIALGVDEWRQGKADRNLEIIYIERLKGDLREDIKRFDNFIQEPLAAKRLVLETLLNANPDNFSFNSKVFNSQNIRFSGYNAIPESQSATYREMMGAGNFRLIQSDAIRLAIDDYYEFYSLMWGILQTSIGDYEKILTESIHGPAYIQSVVDDTELSEDVLFEGLRTLISHPDSKAEINTELHYTAQMTYYLRRLRDRAEILLGTLEGEYTSSSNKL